MDFQSKDIRLLDMNIEFFHIIDIAEDMLFSFGKGLLMIKNCKFTCITVKVEFFSKLKYFTPIFCSRYLSR